jgi:ornithine cyclodeaminase/alanine dehydrogenase-like protein (mu-crystallin family)
MSAPLWISEAEVVSLIDMAGAIGALVRGLALEAGGGAQNMVKTHALWNGHNTLHAIGATVPGAGFVGTKTWAHTEGGATPLLILFDCDDGSLKAVIEAFALGQLRTGGISGVATRMLAAPDADDMALIGTGKQAIAQLAAVAAVRKLRRVRVFGRDAERRAAFVARVRRTLDLPAEEAVSIEAAVAGASIVTLVTRATTPFLTAAMVARGAHINAVGAITPERAEFAADLLGRCGVVAVDEVLINPPAVESKALHWPWREVKSHLDKLEALGKDYVGRRLYLLYNPMTGRTNGTTPNFFATMTIRPPRIVDRPHRHTSAAINYYFHGRGRSTVEGQVLEWKAGDLMLSAPGWAVHNHASYDEYVYELTVQDQPLNIAMESLLWQESLKLPMAVLGQQEGFGTNRAAG